MKPKLLLVADTYYPKVDGTLKFIEEFIKRTPAEFELSLLVPFLGERRGKNVTYITSSRWISLSGYPSMKLSFQNIHLIKKTVREADIVFVQGPALISYLSIYYARRYHKKVIFYVHVIPWDLVGKFLPTILRARIAALVKRLGIFFFNRSDEILVPYHKLRDQLKAEGVKTTMTIAKLGVDINVFSPPTDKKTAKLRLGLDPHKKVVGYVGRVSREKNVSTLLEAFGKLRNKKEVFLLIVGDGPVIQVQEFKRTKNCTVTGFVPNVQDYLRAMDVFVMPSLTETTSLATLEAMSTGLPVIATKVGFMQRYIIRKYNGMFFPRNSPSILAAKIDQLLQDKELRRHLGHNARKTITYSFSWERSISKITRILQEHRP